MLYGLYLSAAGLQAQEYRQSVLTNNLANAQTTGFKRDLAYFQARPNAVAEDPACAQYRVPVLSRQGGGVLAAPTTMDLSQGALEATGNPKDVALEGPGFFLVQDARANRFLTRDGQFTIDNQNRLAMVDGGQAVLSAAGTPIQINPALPLEITTKGEVRQNGTNVAQLAVMDVASPHDLVKRGQNLLALAPGASMRPATVETQVRQNHREASGTEPITEMVAMLEGHRIYEANARMITYADQTLQQLNTVGRVA